jgi:hypothetical protein
MLVRATIDATPYKNRNLTSAIVLGDLPEFFVAQQRNSGRKHEGTRVLST